VRGAGTEPGNPPGPVLRAWSPATGAESIGSAAEDRAAAGDSALSRRNHPPLLAACAPPRSAAVSWWRSWARAARWRGTALSGRADA